MFAVIFEAESTIENQNEYFDMTSDLLPILEKWDGFISMEKFVSTADKRKTLILSYWRNERDITKWRNSLKHQTCLKAGKISLFNSYRIRITEIIRDYTESKRNDAPSTLDRFHLSL